MIMVLIYNVVSKLLSAFWVLSTILLTYLLILGGLSNEGRQAKPLKVIINYIISIG